MCFASLWWGRNTAAWKSGQMDAVRLGRRKKPPCRHLSNGCYRQPQHSSKSAQRTTAQANQVRYLRIRGRNTTCKMHSSILATTKYASRTCKVKLLTCEKLRTSADGLCPTRGAWRKDSWIERVLVSQVLGIWYMNLDMSCATCGSIWKFSAKINLRLRRASVSKTSRMCSNTYKNSHKISFEKAYFSYFCGWDGCT